MRGWKGIAMTLAAFSVALLSGCGGGNAAQQAESSSAASAASSEPAMAESQQSEMELPEGVTVEMVDEGREIYSGAGLCYACHGQDGKGMPGLGADLTDGDWVQIDGSYESLVTLITDGVSAEASTSGTPMSPRGGSSITDDQVRAVGAYVYTLSHGE